MYVLAEIDKIYRMGRGNSEIQAKYSAIFPLENVLLPGYILLQKYGETCYNVITINNRKG